MNYINFLIEQIAKTDKKVITYGGIFNQAIIKKYTTELLALTEKYLITQRKIIHIFIELSQNVGNYSDNKQTISGKTYGVGDLLIYENETQIGFVLGNIIKKEALEILKKKCEIINNLNRDALRELKYSRQNVIPGTNNGTHIGLVMAVLTSKKKLDIKIKKINTEQSFFTINVKIKKTTI